MPIRLLTSGGGTTTIQPTTSAASVTLTIPSVNANVVTTGDTASVTQAMLGSGLAGTGPAFQATRITSNQSLPSITWTKILFNAVDFDTNSVVNTSTGTITPNVAGYYSISASAYINYSSSPLIRMGVRINKNGSTFKGDVTTGTTAFYGMTTISSLVYFNGTTDYLEIAAYQSASSDAVILASSALTYCSGHLVRAA